MRSRIIQAVLVFTTLFAEQTALGQDAVPAQESGGVPEGDWKPMPRASRGRDARLERRLSTQGPSSRARRGPSGTVSVGVPVALNVDRDRVRPGGALDFRGGYNLGFVMPQFELGFAGLPVVLGGRDGEFREPLKQLYFGPGLQFHIPNRSRVTPYLAGAFNFQFWNFREEQIVCDAFGCWEELEFRFSPGVAGRLGMAVQLARHVALDLHLRLASRFDDEPNTGVRTWLSPAVGVTIMR